MIEKSLYDYLNSENTALGFDVYMEQPATKPSAFYILEKTGENQTNQIKKANIVIQSYGPTLYEASVMSEEVISAMQNAISLDEVTGVYLNSNTNYTDSTTKTYRYQAVFVVTFY